jgi:hypothetical protein
VVIRGDTRVADIYLGDFMRRYSDHAFHGSVNQKRSRTRDHPCADDWWKIQCGGQISRLRRVYFSGPPA